MFNNIRKEKNTRKVIPHFCFIDNFKKFIGQAQTIYCTAMSIIEKITVPYLYGKGVQELLHQQHIPHPLACAVSRKCTKYYVALN